MVISGFAAGGPAGLCVLLIGFAAILADAIRSAVEERQREQRQRCKFCKASRELLVRYELL